MKCPSAGRLLHGAAVAAIAYCCLLLLAFALLFGPNGMNTVAGVLLEALVRSLRLLGADGVDGLGLLVFGLAVLASGSVKPSKR